MLLWSLCDVKLWTLNTFMMLSTFTRRGGESIEKGRREGERMRRRLKCPELAIMMKMDLLTV